MLAEGIKISTGHEYPTKKSEKHGFSKKSPTFVDGILFLKDKPHKLKGGARRDDAPLLNFSGGWLPRQPGGVLWYCNDYDCIG